MKTVQRLCIALLIVIPTVVGMFVFFIVDGARFGWEQAQELKESLR